MAGEDVEIAAERLHIDRHARQSLAAIDEHLGALRMRQLDDARDRQKRPGHIRDMRHRDEPRARAQQCLKSREVELAGRIGRRDDEPGAQALAQHLPWHDVRVMLDIADHDLVTGLETGRPPAVGDQIDRLGGAAQKHDFALVGRVQKRTRFLARLLEPVGRAGAQAVDAAMHIGVVGAVELGDAVDDGARLLCAGAGIEKHELRMSREDREFAAHRPRVDPADGRFFEAQRRGRHT